MLRGRAWPARRCPRQLFSSTSTAGNSLSTILQVSRRSRIWLKKASLISNILTIRFRACCSVLCTFLEKQSMTGLSRLAESSLSVSQPEVFPKMWSSVQFRTWVNWVSSTKHWSSAKASSRHHALMSACLLAWRQVTKQGLTWNPGGNSASVFMYCRNLEATSLEIRLHRFMPEAPVA